MDDREQCPRTAGRRPGSWRRQRVDHAGRDAGSAWTGRRSRSTPRSTVVLPAWQPLTVRELDERVRARAAALHALGMRPPRPGRRGVHVGRGQRADFLRAGPARRDPGAGQPEAAGELAALYMSRLKAVGADRRRRARRFAVAGHDYGIRALIGRRAGLGAGRPRRRAAALPAPHGRPRRDHALLGHDGHAQGGRALARRAFTRRSSTGCRCRSRARHRPHAQRAALAARRDADRGEPGADSNRPSSLPLSQQTGPAVLDAIESWQPQQRLRLRLHLGRPGRSSDLSGRELDSVCAVVEHRRLRARGAHPPAGRARQPGGRDVRRAGSAKPGSVFIDGLGLQRDGPLALLHHAHAETNRYGRCVGRPHSFVRPGSVRPGRQRAAGSTRSANWAPSPRRWRWATGTTRPPLPHPRCAATSSPAT